jgi:glycosyltransferase involved in cell wall biosynthesis
VRSRVHPAGYEQLAATGRKNPYRVNLMTFSFDYARRFYRDMGKRFAADRYNIGFWYWEQEHFPVRWHSAFDYYDEVWAPSEFTCAALRAGSPIPVHKITYPFQLDEAQAVADRAQFSLGENDYVFLFNFDYLSTIQRKNPAAVIDAFRLAFAPSEDAVLVLKSINGEQEPAARAALIERASGLRVIFMEEHVTGAEINGLFASADCYVSLHRSEGLGLGMAQAMYLGKPVIGTGYSGNLEFMNAENSLLADYSLVELEETFGPYERGTHWAEADVEHAASLMRWVFENRAEAEALGARGAASIRQTLNPHITAREIVRRVDELQRVD